MKQLNYKYIAALLAVMCFCYAATAQKGVLSGKIIDGTTGQTLIGATVKILGTTQSAVSDIQGNFTIKNIGVGTQAVICSYVSFATDTVGDVSILEGANKLDITMLSASVAMKMVQVEATLKRDNANAIAIVQKNSLVAIDAISSDVIRRSPDKNSGEILKRISGASLQDNKFAIVRGLSDRYNNAMINGALLPSSEPDRRAFAFDIFPSAVIDNLIIYKTAAPDLTSEFAGGIIQITTKDIPDQNFTNLSISQSYNSLTTFKPFLNQQATNKLGFGSTKMPAGFPDRATFVNSTKDQKIAYSKLYANDWQASVQPNTLPNLSLMVNKGITKTIGSQSVLGAIMALTYNNTNSQTQRIRRDYETYDKQLVEYSDQNYANAAVLGALLNVGYKINGNNRITLQNTFNINAENIVLERTGKNFENEQDIKVTAQQTTQNLLLNSQVLGDHYLKNKTIKLKWQAGTVYLKSDVPNLRKDYYVQNQDQKDSYVAYVPFVPSTSYAGRFYSNLSERVYFGGADLSLPFKIGKQAQTLKIGTYNQVKDRSFRARVMGYVINNLTSFNGDLLNLPQNELLAEKNISQTGFRLDEITANTDLYSVNSKLVANYFMLDTRFTEKMHVAWGVRAEYSEQNLFSPHPTTNIDTQLVRNKYMNFLPSFNFIYSLTSKSNLRVSGSQTISRPEFREISPFVFYDFITASLQEGKPNLLPTNIYNADVRLENFAANGQLISMSLFYKKFINPIEQTVFYTGIGTATRSYINAKSAQNLGLEVELKRNFGFLNNFLSLKNAENFGMNANIAIIRSVVDVSNDAFAPQKSRAMQGQSPFVANAGLYYQSNTNGLSASLLYNRIGNRITQVGSFGFANVVENSRNIIDFQLAKRFENNIEIRLTAADILRNPVRYFQDNQPNLKFNPETDVIVFEQRNASNIGLNFTYKF